MNKKFLIIFLFWWAIIFPDLAINDFTSEVLPNDYIDSTTDLSSVSNTLFTRESKSNVSYEFWLNKILFSNQ